MRDIKFRAWHTIMKQMLHFHNMVGIMDGKDRYGIFLPSVEGKMFMSNNYIMYLSDAEILMRMQMSEYIGLQDCNGKDIYEGDIISVPRSTRKFKIVHSQNAACFSVVTLDGIYCTTPTVENCKIYIVIGNVFENPELLEVV